MKALGTMATGVAHDFNNLLSVIRLSSDLIEERRTPDATTQENSDTIQQAVQRGTGLGLSMLHTMAEEDGIDVAVTSAPGQGVTLRLLLPVESPASASGSSPNASPTIALWWRRWPNSTPAMRFWRVGST